MDLKHLQNIQTVFDDAVAAHKVAGLNCAVYKDGKEMGYWQAGYSDLENKKAFNRDTISPTNSSTWLFASSLGTMKGIFLM